MEQGSQLLDGVAVDTLGATTVIDVGVEFASATVMVTMAADRFGISPLHQLRGRVGRGDSAGLCLLVTETESEAVQQRLISVAATHERFALPRPDREPRQGGRTPGARHSRGEARPRRRRHRALLSRPPWRSSDRSPAAGSLRV